jgi:hypothetical protein
LLPFHRARMLLVWLRSNDRTGPVPCEQRQQQNAEQKPACLELR